MTINLSNIGPKAGSKHRRKRISRGTSSGHGAYSGRGQKGQRSRSGGKKKLKIKGLKSTLRRIPKMGGFKSLKSRPAIVNLRDLEKKFKEGAIIDPKTLVEKGLIRTEKSGVKILAEGKITKKFTIKAQAFSQKASQIIKKAGGKTVEL